MTAGAGEVLFDRGRQTLLPGHLYLISGYRMVGQACPRFMVTDWLHFQVESWRLRWELERLPPVVCLPCSRRSWRAATMREVRELFDPAPESYRELRGPRSDARPETRLRVLGVLLGVLGEALERHPASAGSKLDFPIQIQAALDFIDRRYPESPSLGELAQQAGWQKEHFHRKFREQVGVTPLAFMERRRMEEAVQLLTETALPVKAVAIQLRYASPFYFSRVFTRRFGVSPTAFRNRAVRNS